MNKVEKPLKAKAAASPLGSMVDRTHLLKFALELAKPAPWYARPYSSTLGRITGLPTWGLGLHRPDIPFRKWTPERIKEMGDLIKQYEKEFGMEKHPGLLSLGSARLLRQMGRIWSRKDLSLISRLLGTAITPPLSLAATILRMPHYNVFSDTATIFSPEQRVARHELGHLTDLARRKFKVPYLFGTAGLTLNLYPEYVANVIAQMSGKSLDEKKKKELLSMLRRSFGSYMGQAISPAGGIPGAAIARAAKFPRRFESLRSSDKKKIREAIQERLKAKEEKSLVSHLLGVA